MVLLVTYATNLSKFACKSYTLCIPFVELEHYHPDQDQKWPGAGVTSSTTSGTSPTTFLF